MSLGQAGKRWIEEDNWVRRFWGGEEERAGGTKTYLC